MKYLIIPWDDDFEGAEDVLIAISRLKNAHGLLVNVKPRFYHFSEILTRKGERFMDRKGSSEN